MIEGGSRGTTMKSHHREIKLYLSTKVITIGRTITTGKNINNIEIETETIKVTIITKEIMREETRIGNIETQKKNTINKDIESQSSQGIEQISRKSKENTMNLTRIPSPSKVRLMRRIQIMRKKLMRQEVLRISKK